MPASSKLFHRHKCEHCDYSTANKSHLTAHKRTHTGEKPYKCEHPDCDHSCSVKSNLNVHMQTHTGEKPYKCEHPDCDYSCSVKSYLTVHMLTHTGEKPFKCEHPGCGKSFSLNHNFTRHMRTHTGEKPYKCPEPNCSYTSTRKDHLSRHLQYFHDIGKYECQICYKNRNSSFPYTDMRTKSNLKICRECHNKTTGKNSRIEKIWSDYIDKHLGTLGLLGMDKSLKALDIGCSKRRPDRIGVHEGVIEIDECDEHQHRYNNGTYTCEEKRLMEIYESETLVGNPMVVIRWNPDTYKIEKGKKKALQKERLAIFVELKKWARTKYKEWFQEGRARIRVIYMYYDIDSSLIVQRIGKVSHVKCRNDYIKA